MARLATLGLLAATLLLALPASAQTTNTTCTGFGQMVNCNSTTTPSLGQLFEASAEQRARIDAARHKSEDDRLRVVQELAARQTVDDRSKRVGALVADGHCGDARDLALREGDLDLAAKVQNLCAR